MYDVYRKYVGTGKDKPTEKEFYDKVCNELLGIAATTPGVENSGIATTHNHLAGERLWTQAKRPYYKVYPDWIPCLSQTKLNVPSSCLRSPRDAMMIRLPKNHGFEFLTPQADHEVRTILVVETPGKMIIPQNNVERQLTLWINFNEWTTANDYMPGLESLTASIADRTATPVMTYQSIKFYEGDTVESALLRQMAKRERMDVGIGDIDDEIILACAKLVVSVCFLATGAHKLVEPDVLNKHFNRYLTTEDESVRLDLHDKAKKRGKNGYIVGRGREASFPSKFTDSEMTSSTGRKLSHSHIRSGHFHHYWYGVGKKLSKVVFVDQVVVRDDLKPAPEPKGYRSRKVSSL